MEPPLHVLMLPLPSPWGRRPLKTVSFPFLSPLYQLPEEGAQFIYLQAPPHL